MIYIDPTNNKYFQGFVKVIQYHLGKPSEITTDYKKEGLWILNYVSFKNGVHNLLKNSSYIAIQTEHLHIKGDIGYLNFLKNAKKVLDYTKDSIFGYSPIYRLEREAIKDIDILFFGSMNSRRKEVLDTIVPKPVIYNNLFGNELQNIIMRSKIVICIHYYSKPNPDLARIIPLISNRQFVIAETCSDEKLNPLSGIIVTGNANELPKLCEYYLANPLKRLYWIDKSYDFIVNNMKISFNI